MDGQYLTVEIHPNNHCEIFKLFIILQHNDQELLALESNCLDPSPGSATNSATLGKLPHFSIAQCSLPKNGDDVTYFKKDERGGVTRVNTQLLLSTMLQLLCSQLLI